MNPLFSALSAFGWMWVIVLGGAAVVIGNIGFSIQNAAERSAREKATLAESARSILHAELRYNYGMAAAIREVLEDNPVQPIRLATGAWEVASHGNLIQSLSAQEILDIADAYQHALNATHHQDRLTELISGSAATLANATDNRRLVVNVLRSELTLLMGAISRALPPEQSATLTPPVLPISESPPPSPEPPG